MRIQIMLILALILGSCTGTSAVKTEVAAAAITNAATATMQILLPLAIKENLKSDPKAREGWEQTEAAIRLLVLPVLTAQAPKQAPRDSYWAIPEKIYRITSSMVKVFTGYELIELATKDIPKELAESVLHFMKSFLFVIQTTLEETNPTVAKNATTQGENHD